MKSNRYFLYIFETLIKTLAVLILLPLLSDIITDTLERSAPIKVDAVLAQKVIKILSPAVNPVSLCPLPPENLPILNAFLPNFTGSETVELCL